MPTAIETKFNKSRVFLPVIHAYDEGQIIKNIDVAREAGADGVFIISHDTMTSEELIEMQWPVRARHGRGFFLGINLLGQRADIALSSVLDTTFDALWTDTAGIGGNPRLALRRIRWFAEMRATKHWSGLHFGGVAFKWQEPITEQALPWVTALATLGGVDVITTSGEATGKPPDIGKIQRMREAAGEHPIAIASGMTPDNIEPFLPMCDAFLVATGIESRDGWLDPERTAAVARAIRSGGAIVKGSDDQ